MFSARRQLRGAGNRAPPSAPAQGFPSGRAVGMAIGRRGAGLRGRHYRTSPDGQCVHDGGTHAGEAEIRHARAHWRDGLSAVGCRAPTRHHLGIRRHCR